jgi:hypothetical protein
MASVTSTTAGDPTVPYRGDVGGRLGVTMGLWALGLAASAHAAPPPRPRLPPPPSLRTNAEGARLERQADGSFRQVDTDARFVGVVHSDGRVEIRDTPDARVEFTTGVRVVDWMLAFTRAVEGPNHDRPDLETPAPDREDKTRAGVQLMPPSPYGAAPILIGVGGHFGGVGDLALRKGQRKQVHAKQQFLDSTTSLRASLARAQAQEQQRAARARVGHELAALWHNKARPLADRKRELFELWDECEEAMAGDDSHRAAEAISQTDAARGRGGEDLRRRIEAFVRNVAPAGSPSAFDDAELSRLNAGRRSRQRFDPYAPASDEPHGDPAAAGVVAR